MPSGLQPMTTNNSQNASFFFKPLTSFRVSFHCLESFLFISSTCQDITYTPLLGLQCGFYSQGGCWETTGVPGTCQGRKSYTEAQSGAEGLISSDRFLRCREPAPEWPPLCFTAMPPDPCHLTSVSALVLFPFFTEKPVKHQSMYCPKSFRQKIDLQPFLP